MIDREDVIAEIVEHIEATLAVDSEYVTLPLDLLQFALALLKEQDAVKPRVSTAEQRCGHCNKVIEMDGWQFCPWCGKKIDWEGWWKKNGTRNQDS